MLTKLLRLSLGLLLPLVALWPLSTLALDWPQEVTTDNGTIVVYQPQPESLDGNTLAGRAAMSLELADRDDPLFGTFWFEAKIDTDTDAGMAYIRDLTVTRVRWPESTDAAEQRFTAVVEGAVPETGFEIALDRLSASLADAEVVRQSLENLNTDPPAIEFRQELAVLLLYDGEPQFADIENTDYERALNTPFAVARDKQSGRAYVSSGNDWYAADGPLGPFVPTDSPPADLAQMVAAALEQSGDAAGAAAGSAVPPAIVVATTPTELIVTDGAPAFQSLPGGDLLYVQNTETPWLREIDTGNMYLLLSGRWYRARSESGPWTFVRPDELPASFQDIPPESEIGGVRVSVAGTTEAEDAMLDAAIPQTAAIRRDQATLTVEYDGDPMFEAIAGTSVAYAVNTGAQVLEIDDRYYAVDNGVWFEAAGATGPWAVADSIPEEDIQQIPPTAPVYNTTHVHIYESTPEVVYVGYTPGYLWSFPYYGVPVYGTGWYYPPYWGRYYYPRPPTWGLHVGYNPWTGWNYGVSWSNGFLTVGIGWSAGHGPYSPWGCCAGWYGGGYRPPVIINTGNINIGNSINIGNRTEIANRIGNDLNLNGDRTRNIYDRAENRTRNADLATARENLRQPNLATTRENNVFSDRDGNVSRVNGDRWQTLEGDRWQRDREIERAPTRSTFQSGSTRQNQNTSRNPSSFNRGTSLQNANRSRQSGSLRQTQRAPAMGGGGNLGGGGNFGGGGGGRLRR